MEKCTIYLLKNLLDGKVYIGQTWQTLEERFNSGNGYRGSHHIDNAIKLYGKENFTYEILITTENQMTANWLENFWIETFQSRNSKIGYNIRGGGSIGKLSEETKNKISASLKGNTNKRGKIVSDEVKQKMSESRKEYFDNGGLHGMSGKTHTPEAIEKIVAAHVGTKHSEEHKKKISESCKGIVKTEETKQKMRKPKSVKRTKEHTEKLAQALRGKTWKLIDGKRVWI